MGKKQRPPLTAETAWQQLLGVWVHRTEDSTSWVESRHEFTPDRQWVWVSQSAGGIMSGVNRHEVVKEIAAVSVDGHDVLLTLGTKSDPEGVMTVRFRSANRIVIEDGPAHGRIEEAEESADAHES